MTDILEAPAVSGVGAGRAEIWYEPPGLDRLSTIRTMAFAAIVSLILALLGVAANVTALRLAGAYGVVFFGVGAAPFQLRLHLSIYARLTCSILVGFTVLLGVGAFMADIRGAWHAAVAAVLVCLVAAWLHVAGLRRAEKARAAARRRAAWARVQARIRARDAGETLPEFVSGGRLSKLEIASFAATGIGTLLWLVPAAVTRDHNPGNWGMLTKLGPFWYVGLVTVLVGFAAGRRHELTAALSAISFGLATTLTPALVYATPRNPTAAKQMLLTEYVLKSHHIYVTHGIYQAYSALFSGIAWMSSLVGIHGMLGAHSLLAVATYWPVLLVFMRIAVIRLMAGRLLATPGRRWTAVMLVLLVDSLGDDYFSPQSVGYVMAIGAVALVVRGPSSERLLGKRETILLLAAVGCVLGPTHELSPYIAAGALVVLALFGQAPRWAWAPIALPALAWAGLVHRAVSHNFTFASLFDLANFRPPHTVSTPGLHRMAIVGMQSHALLLSLLILIMLGAFGFFPNIRTKWAWSYALSPIVGLALIAINPYGNEGIFRASLFAIPWIAVMAMKMRSPRDLLDATVRPIMTTSMISVCLIAMLASFVVAAYAMDGPSVLRVSDIALFDYLGAQPPRKAFVADIGPDLDVAGYPRFSVNYTQLGWERIATTPALIPLHPNASDLSAFTDEYGLVAAQDGATATTPLYIYWSRAMVLYAAAYGLQTAQAMNSWLGLLRSSPDWSLVFHQDDSYLFKLRRE